MRHPLRVAVIVVVAVGLSLANGAEAVPPNPLSFDPPAVTTWKPVGCRSVPVVDPVLGARDGWHMLHSDICNSDEVSIAMAPMFAPDWLAEPNTLNVTVPTFDHSGHLYFAPFLPYENVTMISLDQATGRAQQRRDGNDRRRECRRRRFRQHLRPLAAGDRVSPGVSGPPPLGALRCEAHSV